MTARPNWAGRRVLVTGARGFIGGAICRRLVAEGAHVVGVSRRPPPTDDRGILWRQVDCTDAQAVDQLLAMDQPDLVYHMATDGGNQTTLDSMIPILNNDLVAAVHVMTAAAHHRVERTIIAASLEEPPQAGDAPLSPYAAAKTASTLYGQMMAAAFSYSVGILRPFMGYGPGQSATKLAPSAIRAALAGEPLEMGTGRKQTEWIFIDDLAEAFVLAGAAAALPAAPLDLGTGVSHTTREVVDAILRLIPGAPPPIMGAREDMTTDSIHRRANVEETARWIGFQAKVDLETGLARTIAAMRATDAVG